MVKSFNPSQHTQKQKIQTAQPKRHTRIHRSLLPQTGSLWHKCCSSLQHTTSKSFCQGARTHSPNRTETKRKTQRQELLTPRNTHTTNSLGKRNLVCCYIDFHFIPSPLVVSPSLQVWERSRLLVTVSIWLLLSTAITCCYSLEAQEL